MPELCRFYGIVIQIYFTEHGPPHFHAKYSGDQAMIDIANLYVMEGRLPARARRLVMEWASLHQENSGRLGTGRQRGEAPGKIAPLD